MKNIINKISLTILFSFIYLVTYAQQPTHYPEANEPIQWTLGNILVYIGGPVLLFIVYYYYRKWEKKKRLNKKSK